MSPQVFLHTNEYINRLCSQYRTPNPLELHRKKKHRWLTAQISWLKLTKSWKCPNDEKYIEKMTFFDFSNFVLISLGGVWGISQGTKNVWETSKIDFHWSIFRQFLVDFHWFSCYIDLEILGFSRNSPNFDRLYLRAQEELEARTTCVVKPRTWSLWKINF